MYVGVGRNVCRGGEDCSSGGEQRLPQRTVWRGYEQRRDCPNNNYMLPDRVVLYD